MSGVNQLQRLAAADDFGQRAALAFTPPSLHLPYTLRTGNREISETIPGTSDPLPLEPPKSHVPQASSGILLPASSHTLARSLAVTRSSSPSFLLPLPPFPPSPSLSLSRCSPVNQVVDGLDALKRARDEPALADDGLDFQQLLASVSRSARGKGGAPSPAKQISPWRRATQQAALYFGRRNRAGTDRKCFVNEHQNPGRASKSFRPDSLG